MSKDYEHYLFMLQERNKLLKKLRQKDSHQIELEKKEQGFSLYLNGANLNKPKKVPPTRKGRPQTRQRTSKTAGEPEVKSCERTHEPPAEDRAKTAPSKRKSWVCDSLELKTEDGAAVHVAAPGFISGHYDEDFEPPPETSELNVSFEDISTLRKSLERDSTIITNLQDSIEVEKDYSSSSDSSCSEDLESHDDCSPHTSPSILQEESGIVIEFASQHQSTVSLVSLPSTVRVAGGVEQESSAVTNDEQVPLKVLNTSPIAIKGGRVGEFHSSVADGSSVVTQSLSAVRRKQASLRTNETALSQAVIDAVSAENELITHQTSVTLSGIDSAHHEKEASCESSLPEHPQLVHTRSTSAVVTEQESAVDTGGSNDEPQLTLPNRPLSQFKPVLVNRYKSKPSGVSPCLASQTPTVKVQPAGDSIIEHSPSVGTAKASLRLMSQVPTVEVQSGDSLTEHTLSVITAKVRKMDASKQRRLLDLLTRLDTPTPPSQLSTPTPPSSHLSPPTTRGRHTLSPLWLGDTPTETTHRDNVIPPPRPTSTRTTGLRAKLASQLGTCESRPQGDTLTETHKVILPPRPTSTRTTGLRAKLASQPGTCESRPQGDMPTDKMIPPPRPTSTRTTGLRAKLASQPVTCESRPQGDMPTETDKVIPPPRPTSTRTTGLRAKLASQPGTCESRPHSEQASKLKGELGDGRCHGDMSLGRVSGLRGELRSGRVSSLRKELKSGCGQLACHSEKLFSCTESDHDIRSSSSNPCLLSNIDLTGDNLTDQTLIRSSTRISPHREPRLNTAVLAKGHRRLPLVDQSLETYLVDDVSDLGDYQTTPTVVAPPMSSEGEPEMRPAQSHTNRRECLESISKFDHTHLGQLNPDFQEDILESFLSDYREQHSVVVAPVDLDDDDEFVTPELPRGHELVVHILSTWGDRFYVGLTGLEIYAVTGELAQVKRITASPSDINDLPEYSDDPRVVSNLLDGVNQTRDDLHMWLAPFTPGHTHTVTIQFTQPTTLAVIRVWNYNKSRIHSARGARLVEMTLDQRTIFHGEIARGDNCETILFTTDEDILYLVSQHDTFYQSQTYESGQLSGDLVDPYRPSTGGDSSTTHRPFTSAECRPSGPSSDWQGDREECGGPSKTWQNERFDDKEEDVSELLNTWQGLSEGSGSDDTVQVNLEYEVESGHRQQLSGQVLQLTLTETWGDSSSVGLTGLSVLTSGGGALQLRGEQVVSEVKGQRCSGAEQLLDSVNVTCDAEHMWAVPFDSSQPPILTLSLDTPTHITGVVVWNYNASVEDSYSGVKVMHVHLDGFPLTPESGWLVRRAPGHMEYEFGQLLSLEGDHAHSDPAVDGASSYPRGFVYQLQLLSSWEDPYYIGLNEVELYNASGQLIPLSLDNIAAYPDSVNILPGVKGDLRTPDKLVDGVRGVDEPQHMWLAPILPGVVNSVYVIFNEPWTVSEIRLWNYGKTPNRGVRDMAVLVDGLLVYSGTVPRVLSHARGILPTLQPPLEPFVIPLGEGVGLESRATQSSQSEIQLTNNREVVSHARKPPPLVANQDLRPMTSLTQRQHHKHW